jgi:hypothetical protein
MPICLLSGSIGKSCWVEHPYSIGSQTGQHPFSNGTGRNLNGTASVGQRMLKELVVLRTTKKNSRHWQELFNMSVSI